jgi:hypothetical protein
VIKNQIIINRIEHNSIFEIVPLKVKRDWMNDSVKGFAYHCLPLNIANHYGWAVLSPADFTIVWWGGKKSPDIDISVDGDIGSSHILSYFGESIFTIHPDFIVKTPENYSLYIRGIPNEARPGVRPLDAIVETDWLTFTFTYNFMLIEPGIYEFKKGEPLFCFFPIERNTVENFGLVEQHITNDKDLEKGFIEYMQHSEERRGSDKHDKFYLRGMSPSRKKYNIKNHITRLIFGEGSGKID